MPSRIGQWVHHIKAFIICSLNWHQRDDCLHQQTFLREYDTSALLQQKKKNYLPSIISITIIQSLSLSTSPIALAALKPTLGLETTPALMSIQSGHFSVRWDSNSSAVCAVSHRECWAPGKSEKLYIKINKNLDIPIHDMYLPSHFFSHTKKNLQ